AEARLAAKRAARAEARSIRLKELERQQQEGENVDDDDLADEPPIPPARKKTPVARSISTGTGMSTVAIKDQSMDMNGPLVPEKVLKSIQVCVTLCDPSWESSKELRSPYLNLNSLHARRCTRPSCCLTNLPCSAKVTAQNSAGWSESMTGLCALWRGES
ncbi:nucleic acid-templated transcription, partial [Desmophyllum pertusum]